MFTAVVLACLSAPEYTTREWAESAARTLPRLTLLAALNASDDPEAKPRLYRAYRRAVMHDLQALLPDWHPYWPDCDYCPLPPPEDGDSRFSDLRRLGFWVDGECWHAGLNAPWRRFTQTYLFEHAVRTGDLGYPAWVLWCGCLREAQEGTTPNLFVVWFSNPYLCKGAYK